ncbi:uncharacterized protein LOC124169198 [Ischnura elegans]|uniref:uncharacterized protein LOC124169198 n=1 Tax=Ischnura elegans TaxID=197161 RepID=UPI001ED878E2|nr:uncharacterized protein LOC124169198 [Ischnura elegans]
MSLGQGMNVEYCQARKQIHMVKSASLKILPSKEMTLTSTNPVVVASGKRKPSKRVRDQIPEETSDSETEERANGRGISPPPIYVNITHSHEPATQPESIDVQDSYPIMVLPGISNENNEIEMVIDHREDFTMVQQPSRNGAERCTCSHGNVDDKLNAILSKLVKMEQQMREQASMLAMLTKEGGNSVTQANRSMEKTFPLKTLKEFEELECSLESDPELFEQVVQTLFKYKGATVWGRQCTTCCTSA